MKLIIVNGLPATGKTTLVHKLSGLTGIPVIAKDAIKEFLFDSIGTGDREWSRALGAASSDFMWELADIALSSKRSVILENFFTPAFARPQLEKLTAKHDAEVLEIFCEADPELRKQRFIDRNESGQRHKGHVDETNYGDFERFKQVEFHPLAISEVIRVNTDNPSRIDHAKLAAAMLKNSAQNT